MCISRLTLYSCLLLTLPQVHSQLGAPHWGNTNHMSAQQKVKRVRCTTQCSWYEGSSRQREGIQAHFCHPALVQRDSHFSHRALGSVIITNFYVLAYHHGGLGIFFFRNVTLQQSSGVMGTSFLLKDRLFSVTLVGIYNYYGTWIIWAVPYEDWSPFMGCVWEQQRNPCCSNGCQHPQTAKQSCGSAAVMSPVAAPESRSLPTLHSEHGSDLACF